MSKYDVLAGFLKSQLTGRFAVTFGEVEEALGFGLPASAYAHPAWWSNDPTGHSQARAWLDAGFETEQVDMPGRRLVFRRLAPGDGGRWSKEAITTIKRVDRHPAAGAMKGTFTFAHDITRPAPADADLDRKVRLIEAGLSKPQ